MKTQIVEHVLADLVTNSHRTLALLRPGGSDARTPEGRARERHRRILFTSLASAAAHGIRVLTTLVSVPLTVHYLGPERYGLWVTISSVNAILGFADLGLGNGLLNSISEAHGRDDRGLAARSVSSAFFLLLAITLVLAVLAGAGYRRLPWAAVLNVSSATARTEAGPAMAVFFACFLVNVPLGIVQRIQGGYQEGFANSIWQALGNVAGFAAVLLAISLRASLPWLVLAMSGAPVLAAAANAVYLFGRQRPWLLPRWRLFCLTDALRILRLGLQFFALQVAVALAYSTDNLVITRILGPEAVTRYAVPRQLFGVAPMILSLVLAPLWPAYGESVARGDIPWIEQTIRRSLLWALLIAGLPSLVLVVFGVPIVHLWVGPDVTPTGAVLLGMGAWTVLSGLGNAVAMFLNGCNILGVQVVTSLLMAAGALAAKILLGRIAGLAGVAWATFISYLLFSAIPLGIYTRVVVGRLAARH